MVSRSFLIGVLTVGMVFAPACGNRVRTDRALDGRGPSSLAENECVGRLNVNLSERCDYEIKTDRGVKKVHVLKLRGDTLQTAYDHGFLMAEEIEAGSLKVATDVAEGTINNGSETQRTIARAIFNCYLSRLRRSVSSEYLKSTQEIYRGLSDRLRQLGRAPRYTEEQAITALLGVELGNIIEGTTKRMEDNPAVLGEVISTCALGYSAEAVRGVFKAFGTVFPKLGGCIGFSIPASLSEGNQLIHARNLDLDMVAGFNVAPTLFVVEHPGKIKYAATSGAGVNPGGIGGMNEAGLAVSLHQMSTTTYRSFHNARRGMIAPVLTQAILENARTIEEALEIARRARKFASWTLLISEARTGRVASIEFSAEKTVIARAVEGRTMGQTNHFIAREMQDQAFTYSYAKKLETESRLNWIDHELSQLASTSPADASWAMDRLAGHIERLPGYEAFRAFGRTSVKAYNVMASVMVPARGEIWTSIGERTPAAHSTIVGFRVDFARSEASPFAQRRTPLYQNRPNWEKSLESYVDAREAYASFLGNDPVRAERHLSEALRLARLDGIEELTYLFIRARVNHRIGSQSKNSAEKRLRLLAAREDWDRLWARRSEFHEYGRALIALYSVATLDELDGRFEDKAYGASDWMRSPERASRVRLARDIFETLASRDSHFDLEAKRKLAREIGIPKRGRELPSIDFVTVEE